MEGANMETKNLCCGRLFYAEIVDGRIVLECCTCGKLWETTSEGGLVPLGERGSVETSGNPPLAAAS